MQKRKKICEDSKPDSIKNISGTLGLFDES